MVATESEDYRRLVVRIGEVFAELLLARTCPNGALVRVGIGTRECGASEIVIIHIELDPRDP